MAARTSRKPSSPACRRASRSASSSSSSADAASFALAGARKRPVRSDTQRATSVHSRLGSSRGSSGSPPVENLPMARSSSTRLMASAAAYAICVAERGRAAQSEHCIALSSDLPVHARSWAARPASEESAVPQRHASRRSTTPRAMSGASSRWHTDCSRSRSTCSPKPRMRCSLEASSAATAPRSAGVQLAAASRSTSHTCVLMASWSNDGRWTACSVSGRHSRSTPTVAGACSSSCNTPLKRAAEAAVSTSVTHSGGTA
eukprot:scaffold115728_cov67-Phaeocystis_antarctica.AAC.6